MATLRTIPGQAQGTAPTDGHKTSLNRCKALSLWGISLIAAFVLLPFVYSTASAQDQQAQQALHALLVSSQPAADAVLQSPPTSVQMVFSEALIPATSKALVVDTTNRQVDMKDSHVNESNGEEIDLTLPLIPAGTYVVVWQTQSATDGHVAGGSFLFRIARPDGSVPPIPAVLPTGHVPGAGGIGVQSSTSLDGPTLLQTIATWIALLLFTFWAGGIIWETWVFSPNTKSVDISGFVPLESPTSGGVGDSCESSSSLRSVVGYCNSAIEQASQRWRMYTPYALVGILIANVGIIIGLAAELAGDWSGSVSFPLLHAILFESHFGTFWWLREGVTLVALFFTVGQSLRLQHRQASTKPAPIEDNASTIEAVPNAVGVVPCADPVPNASVASYTGDSTHPTVPDANPPQDALLRGAPALIKVLQDIPHLPGHLIEGIRQHSWSGRIECLLALTLMYAFALSGHAAAISSSAVWAVIGIDLLHLLAEAAWIGGLLYISVILLPTLNRYMKEGKPLPYADALAIGLPRFSVIAITSVILLAATGSFNTAVHLTSLQQFWTTIYGRTLTIKIVIFLLMIGISAYHAFFLRPRLAYALVETDEQTISSHAHILGKSLERWLRLEGMLGTFVLLCVALLAAFAGSLTASTSPTASSRPTGPVSQTKTVDGYTITLKVTPATFGTNKFIVLVKNAQGQPETGAAVSISTTMLDMDMGTETTQIQADPNQPGEYSQQADLNMGGRWEVGVRVLPANSKTFVKAIFDFSAS